MIFIHPKINNNSQTEIIRFLCSKLAGLNFINPEYTDEVIKREKVHPTGLPTLPYSSAVPHANPIGVKKTGIALAVMDEPVPFYAMDNPKQSLDVNLVFLMAFLDGDQVRLLSWISNILCDQDNVKKISEARSSEEAYKIIEPFLNSNNLKRGENVTDR